MARDGIKIEMVGDKELQRKFKTLELKVQKKIVRPALRASAKRAKAAVIAGAP